MSTSSTHLVLIPSFDTGPRLRSVVLDVLNHWQPVLVVDDGSSDGSVAALAEIAASHPALTILSMPSNRGKGAAVLTGLAHAHKLGFTHALVMDADGQHPSAHIERFMNVSAKNPDAMILGQPQFGPEAPAVRVQGRKLSRIITQVSTLGPAIADPLFGFRVYPIEPLLRVLGARSGGRGYDFDTEAAIRLFWAGVRPINLLAPVQYFRVDEGGVSHFHYIRDNMLLVGMHIRLLVEFAFSKFPETVRNRRKMKRAATLTILVGALLASGVNAEAQVPVDIASPAHALNAQIPDPFWNGLAVSLAAQGSVSSDFLERRFFPFRLHPVELQGEVRIEPKRGLSLHYTTPTESTVIVDEQGLLLRGDGKNTAPPSDPRAAGANSAMLDILRLNLAGLEKNYMVYGVHTDVSWELELVARTSSVDATIGTIYVSGIGATVSRIDLRHSEKQRIEITMANPHTSVLFSTDDIKRYFR